MRRGSRRAITSNTFAFGEVLNVRMVQRAPARGRIATDVELRNVMAILPGRTPRRIYVSGHYDSLNLGAGGQQSSNYNIDAPGANDDGSGTVLSMELARVFAKAHNSATSQLRNAQ